MHQGTGRGGESPTARRGPHPVTAGSTRSRPRRAAVGLVALGLTAGGLAGMPAQAIDTDPPSGPGNIEVFTKRDMVAIEGYSEYAGKQAEIKVIRDGAVVGSAVGTVDGTGFLETNHPGGICWGEGTSLKVTPDIRGGDEVRVDFLGTGGRWDGATTQDVEIDSVVRDDGSRTLTISGHFGADVDFPGADLVADPGRFGIEIVNPDMRAGTSGIGERAIGWPVEAGEVTPGYTVTGGITEGTEGAGGRFAVVYTFDSPSDLDLAEAGEHVALAWQADHPDPDQEAQLGLTMWENGESAGPGMGGCPAGPQEIRADSPTVYTGRGAGAGAGIEVAWEPATVAPDAPAVTGYSVRAVDDAGDEVGKRVGAGVHTAALAGLTDGQIYTVEIASRSANGESSPVASMRLKAGPHIRPEATATTDRTPDESGKYLPLVTTADGVDYGVHLDPTPGLVDAEVHYTLDGSTPTLDSPTFVPGQSASLQIGQDTTVKWVVVDSGNIVGPVGERFFDVVESTEQAPDVLGLVPLDSAVEVTLAVLPDADEYRVQAYTGDSTDEPGGIRVRVGDPHGVLQPTDPAVTELARHVPGLTNDTPYRFTVAARFDSVWTAESSLSDVATPVAAPGANAGPDQTSLRGRQVSLDGTASVAATSYAWAQLRPTAEDGWRDPAVTLSNSDTATPSFRFPLMTDPARDDDDLEFLLTTTHTDGTDTTTTVDRVVVTAQADVVVAEEVRWRGGDELEGTGSQEDAVLTFLDGSLTGDVVGEAVVTAGEWSIPAGSPALVGGGVIHVWSDHGFVGRIQTTD